MRLIDADELMEHSGWYNLATGKSIHGAQDFEIASMQTIDAVPVVRCKECKMWQRHTEVDRERGPCMITGMTTHQDDFCSCVEPKEGQDG